MNKMIMTGAALLIVFLAGCSSDSVLQGIADDESRAALIEEAAIALDAGDYDTALRLLDPLYSEASPDPEVVRIISSAYAGKVGIDILNLAITADDSSYSNFDFLSSAFTLSQGARYISGQNIDARIASLEKAREPLIALVDHGLASYDDAVRLGLISSAHLILTLGNRVAKVIYPYSPGDKNYTPGGLPIPITTEAYRQYQQTGGTFLATHNWAWVIPTTFVQTDNLGVPVSPTTYQEDLFYMNDAVEAFRSASLRGNDIVDRLEAFLREVLPLPSGEITDGVILEAFTSERIFTYLNTFTKEEPDESGDE
ncbi:MAG TPA: hypothetical protein ENN34_11925 [Deltaproteobacteria bacterium]|nr:hypothetical protein [Deltaproteobacteria bacterium]